MSSIDINSQDELVLERYELALERISTISGEKTVDDKFRPFFSSTAHFILLAANLAESVKSGIFRNASDEWHKEMNHRLYEDILPVNYDHSYGNPQFAVSQLGEEYGQILSFLYTEIRSLITYAVESRYYDMTITNELFLEIYHLFEQSKYPKITTLKQSLYWFISDYSDVTMDYRFKEQIDPDMSFYRDIIMTADLNDLTYLYHFGEYVTDNELKIAEYLNGLDKDAVDKMARTFVDGYIRGFEVDQIDLSEKKTVALRSYIGFERISRRVITLFKEHGLETIVFKYAVNSSGKKTARIGLQGTSANKQFDYDHRFDQALYLDKALNERRLAVSKVVYEKYKELAKVYAGPACQEVFGEEPFAPENKAEVLKLSEKQQKLSVEYMNQSAILGNEYMDRSKISFTIIAYPLPEIGAHFHEIFDEVVKVNTLDNAKYEQIQQHIIEALDKADYVHIKGAEGNQTDLKVKLQVLEDPQTQSNFFNCVADVNIPLGEVFTSPKLNGTEGILHVSSVYLNELNYVDLKICLANGMVSDYNCANFESEDANKKYIKDNVFLGHDSLPLGEFAIGTNTTAYAMGRRFNIMHKLPILIVEKTGPHFAVGDTCYSRSEENKVYNPDGREIIARDNEISIKRKTEPDKAYYNCHTDITIPYDEIGEIAAVKADGERIVIIQNGRFVLSGTESLNEALSGSEC